MNGFTVVYFEDNFSVPLCIPHTLVLTMVMFTVVCHCSSYLGVPTFSLPRFVKELKCLFHPVNLKFGSVSGINPPLMMTLKVNRFD